MYNSVTLEMSLKPFKQTDDAYIESVCKKVFEQWRPLVKNAKEISIMLWTADGSEILDYNSDMEAAFEWCCFMGTANLELATEKDRPDLSLHAKKRIYMENPPVMTYGILKKIVASIKKEGHRQFPDAVIRVGETFDIGPEFAISDFKYSRHREICSGAMLDECRFVDSTALLNADTRAYAAYPDGIPQGTPFGLFLGKQSQCFLSELGFDYIWLSNGLGFSDSPWSMTGKIYDGEKFYPERLKKTRDSVFEFWKQFRLGCPDFPIETRGTNNSVGIDYATDGVPLQAIYDAGLNITPPPNSPWAALNFNFGLELMGHMTRIANIPGEGFLFRYYIHDPWWVNSPWYDRYDGQPHDIYLPMSVARIDKEGRVLSADRLNLLSIDNTFGDMPDCCVNEPVPHLLKAEKDKSDEAAPFVWVYPVREYTTTENPELLREMFLGDRFVEKSINDGFPLNCVVSTDNFMYHSSDIYRRSVLISPVPERKEVLKQLINFANEGIKIIVYGTEKSLKKLPDNADFICIDIEKNKYLREAAFECGYQILHRKYYEDREESVVPTLTVNKSNNAYWFSVYNSATTTKTLLKFPQGAPILMGGETLLEDGYASYHFARAEHRECRIFVKQSSGIISAMERPPVNAYNRRTFRIYGLKDAEVIYYPETYCIDNAKVGIATGFGCTDATPVYSDAFKFVHDPKYGSYYKAEHVSGEFCFHMPYKKFTDK